MSNANMFGLISSFALKIYNLLMQQSDNTLKKISIDYYRHELYGQHFLVTNKDTKKDVIRGIIFLFSHCGVVYDGEWEKVLALLEEDLVKYTQDSNYYFDPSRWEMEWDN